MDRLSDALVIIGLFVLRLGVPLSLTLAIGYALRRLDARWQAEAETRARAGSGDEPETFERVHPQQQPKSSVWSVVRQPVPQPALVADSAGAPCWSLKGCTEAMRLGCAATYQLGIPCWEARRRAEGRLPATCKGCDLYRPYPSAWASQYEIRH